MWRDPAHLTLQHRAALQYFCDGPVKFTQQFQIRCITVKSCGANASKSCQPLNQKDRPRGGLSEIRSGVLIRLRSAAAFRFLRQPSRPKAPRPLAKSGKAAGNGVVAVLMVIDWMSACAEIVPLLFQLPISTPDLRYGQQTKGRAFVCDAVERRQSDAVVGVRA